MKYKLLRTSKTTYSDVNDNNEYNALITLAVIHLEGLFIGKEVSVDLSIPCNNEMKGSEEDIAVDNAIVDFCKANEIEILTETSPEDEG